MPSVLVQSLFEGPLRVSVKNPPSTCSACGAAEADAISTIASMMIGVFIVIQCSVLCVIPFHLTYDIIIIPIA